MTRAERMGSRVANSIRGWAAAGANVAATAANPFGATLAGAFVLAVPAVTLFIVFQRYFTSTNLGSGVKG